MKRLPPTFASCLVPHVVIIARGGSVYITPEFIFCMFQQVQTFIVPLAHFTQMPIIHTVPPLAFSTHSLFSPCFFLSAQSSPLHFHGIPSCGWIPFIKQLPIDGHMNF